MPNGLHIAAKREILIFTTQLQTFMSCHSQGGCCPAVPQMLLRSVQRVKQGAGAGLHGVRASREGECTMVLHQDASALQGHHLPVDMQASEVHV